MCLAIDFPPPDGSEKERVWAVAAGRAPCVAKWNRLVISDRKDDESERAVDDQEAESSEPQPATLSAAFRNVAAASNEVQMFVLNRVRVAIEIGTLKTEDVNWLAEDSGWFDDVFRLLPLDLFKALGDSLLGLLRVSDDEWKVKVPHLLRVQAERRELEAERRFQAATMVLYASAVAGRVGALVAMIDALSGEELRDKIDTHGTLGSTTSVRSRQRRSRAGLCVTSSLTHLQQPETGSSTNRMGRGPSSRVL